MGPPGLVVEKPRSAQRLRLNRWVALSGSLSRRGTDPAKQPSRDVAASWAWSSCPRDLSRRTRRRAQCRDPSEPVTTPATTASVFSIRSGDGLTQVPAPRSRPAPARPRWGSAATGAARDRQQRRRHRAGRLGRRARRGDRQTRRGARQAPGGSQRGRTRWIGRRSCWRYRHRCATKTPDTTSC